MCAGQVFVVDEWLTTVGPPDLYPEGTSKNGPELLNGAQKAVFLHTFGLQVGLERFWVAGL